eukprot:761765-Hanusia_phi.AAC.2
MQPSRSWRRNKEHGQPRGFGGATESSMFIWIFEINNMTMPVEFKAEGPGEGTRKRENKGMGNRGPL